MSALGPWPRSRPRCPPCGASCAGVLFGVRTFAKGFSWGRIRLRVRLGVLEGNERGGMGVCICKVERWEKSAREKLTRGDHPRAQGRLGMDQTLLAIFDRNCGVEED